MAFACIYISDFLVQAVVRAQPILRKEAIALIGGAPPLWEVVAANSAALQAGIHLGMTKAQAEEFCRIKIMDRSESQEKAAHAALMDVAWSMSPRVEDTASDIIVLDLQGLESLFGSGENIGRELAERVSKVDLVAHIAIASNIETAIYAARGFSGVTIIPMGEEARCLSGLPVSVLAITPEILKVLESWGIETFQDLTALPVLQLSERLGQEGVGLHQRAQGVYTRALILAELKVYFEEQMEIDDAVEDLEPLSFLLGRLLDQLCARLEARALAIRAVHVRFDLEPSFEKDCQSLKDETRKKTASKEYVRTLNLPVPTRNSKMLLKLLRLQLQSDPPVAPVQKIIMRVDSAGARTVQNGLFVPAAPDPEKLELTVARLTKLVGDANVGSPELLDTFNPANFRMNRFSFLEDRVAGRSGKLHKEKNVKRFVAAQSSSGKILPTFRAIRPALPITVELREERPVRACLRGAYGEVVASSGPWRSSGDWWQPESWNQDEWDFEVDFSAGHGQRQQNRSVLPQSGIYRVYYDALQRGWFVKGIYD
ncbi:MAG TPA: DNA polymerase Y family protein [Candidatus Acidoferrum sp.]|jgi:protein ImuB